MTLSANNHSSGTLPQEGQPPGTDLATLPDAAQAEVHLNGLTPLLQDRGITATLYRPLQGPPALRMFSDAQPTLTGDVIADSTSTAETRVSGDAYPAETWSYWWTWAERIGPVTEPDKAARIIAENFAPIGRPDHAA